MGNTTRPDASIQSYFPSTPRRSPTKQATVSSSSNAPIGDGFTAEEVRDALRPEPAKEWQPPVEYADCEIRDLVPGPKAVTFMGRVANIFDVANTPKTPKSAKACLKICVKDCDGAVTVRFWYASRFPNLRLGSLVSIWTNHISNGENGTLSSLSAPLFVSLFPERDRSCHLMLHENSDNGMMYKSPLGYREGRPLKDAMTLQNFNAGGFDVVDAKILVVVKSVGHRKKVTRKDNSTVDNVNLIVHDDTAEAILGLWGTSATSPFGLPGTADENTTDPEAAVVRQPWRPGETVLLLQAPGWKIGSRTYLSLTSATILDIDPAIPDGEWLRKWALRQKSREAVNPPFPEDVFDIDAFKHGPIRCLFTIAELDEFARAVPGSTFQGYLSVLIMGIKLIECSRRHMLMSGDCCSMPVYANAMTATCKNCEGEVALRLNPRILGQVIDETASISSGKLLFRDEAWRELLGRGPEELLKMGQEQMNYLADRLLFSRISLMFGWSGDDSKAGGRICVLGVSS